RDRSDQDGAVGGHDERQQGVAETLPHVRPEDQLPKIILTARKAGAGQQDYLRLTLHDASVVLFELQSQEAKDQPPTTKVELSFRQMEIDSLPQDKDGSLSGPSRASTTSTRCRLRFTSSTPALVNCIRPVALLRLFLSLGSKPLSFQMRQINSSVESEELLFALTSF